jgi:hypothetical protein
MAEFCGECCQKMGAPREISKYGDFSYLLDELKSGEEETVLCEGRGWVTYKKVVKFFISHELEIVNREMHDVAR